MSLNVSWKRCERPEVLVPEGEMIRVDKLLYIMLLFYRETCLYLHRDLLNLIYECFNVFAFDKCCVGDINLFPKS